MQNLKISIDLQSSVAMSHAPTFDATLAGMLWKETHDPQIAMKPPVDTLNGIPMASLPHFVNGYEVRKAAATSSFSRLTTINPSMGDLMHYDDLKGETVKDLNASYSSGHSKFVNTLSFIPNIVTHGLVEYYVRGDKNAIEDLLETHNSIGSWTSKGYGRIEEYVIDVDESEDPYFGIMRKTNYGYQLLRPVPLSFAKEHNITGLTHHTIGRYQNPYNPVVCNRHGYEFEDIILPFDREILFA